METKGSYLLVGILLCGGLFLGVAAKPTLPSWLWEPVPPSEGTCAHFRGNISQEGYVSSPKYPSNYPDSLTCEMIIYVPPHHMTRIYFTDFALESSRNCWLDSLAVYEFERKLIGKFCGRETPPLIISFDQKLRLVFTSDRYVSSRGFRARLQFLPLF